MANRNSEFDKVIEFRWFFGLAAAPAPAPAPKPAPAPEPEMRAIGTSDWISSPLLAQLLKYSTPVCKHRAKQLEWIEEMFTILACFSYLVSATELKNMVDGDSVLCKLDGEKTATLHERYHQSFEATARFRACFEQCKHYGDDKAEQLLFLITMVDSARDRLDDANSAAHANLSMPMPPAAYAKRQRYN
jgi:hypothetical protein